MSSAGSALSNEIISALRSDVVSAYCELATCALVLYDQVIMFDREVRLIWGRKWSSVTLIYHLNRWFTFMWAIQLATSYINITMIPACAAFWDASDAVKVALLLIWAAFSTVRTYAVGNNSLPLAAAIGVLTTVPAATNVYNSIMQVYVIEEVPGLQLDCQVESKLSPLENLRFAIANRICIITADILILFVTWARTIGTIRLARSSNTQAPVAVALVRDGTLYFLVLVALNVLNILGFYLKDFDWAASDLVSPISSIVISHFLLDLRHAAADAQEGSVHTPHLTTIPDDNQSLRFANVVDNMDADIVVHPDAAHTDPDMAWVEPDGEADVTGSLDADVEQHGAASLTQQPDGQEQIDHPEFQSAQEDL